MLPCTFDTPCNEFVIVPACTAWALNYKGYRSYENTANCLCEGLTLLPDRGVPHACQMPAQSSAAHPRGRPSSTLHQIADFIPDICVRVTFLTGG